jgi:cytochrome P450
LPSERGRWTRPAGDNRRFLNGMLHVLVRLLLGFASANWDGTVFENPDSFKISRKPIRHFAFGSGRHFCLGAPLSRLEGRIILPRFLSRFPNYRLVNLPPARNEDLTFPSIERLFIELGRSD